MSFLRYLKNLIVFTALLSLVAGILSFTLPKEYFVQQVWMILVYFMLVSALFYFILQRKQQEPKKYIRTFLAGTTIKLFAHMIALIVFALADRDRAIPVIITFFSCYLLFTIFEVALQMKERGQDNSAGKPG
jgi:F0F1-type ATP synthase assembly protein I